MPQVTQLTLVSSNQGDSPEQKMRDLGALHVQMYEARLRATAAGLTAVWNVLYKAMEDNEAQQTALLAQHPELLEVFIKAK